MEVPKPKGGDTSDKKWQAAKAAVEEVEDIVAARVGSLVQSLTVFKGLDSKSPSKNGSASFEAISDAMPDIFSAMLSQFQPTTPP